MRKTKMIFVTVALAALLTACATTQPADKSSSAEATKKEQTKKHSEVKEASPVEKFIKSLEGISITKVSSPKEVNNGKSFAAPFIFNITKNDAALADFPVTVEYPVSKSADGINFIKSNLKSDENGNITFTADATTFAANTKIKAYPTPSSDIADSEGAELSEKLKPFTAEADWKVKSNIVTKGALLCIWDLNEKGKPGNNSYEIQSKFRSKGITLVGNGPVSESTYIGKPQTLYRETLEYITPDAYGYLLYGTISFEQPVTANEDGNGYTCIMKSEIEALSMKSGAKVYSKTITYESNGKNWHECVSNGKSNLAELAVTDIIYGL